MAFMKFKERSAKRYGSIQVGVTASALLGTAAAAAERYRDLQPPVTTQTSEPVHVVIDKTAADCAGSTAEQTEKASESTSVSSLPPSGHVRATGRIHYDRKTSTSAEELRTQHTVNVRTVASSARFPAHRLVGHSTKMHARTT